MVELSERFKLFGLTMHPDTLRRLESGSLLVLHDILFFQSL